MITRSELSNTQSLELKTGTTATWPIVAIAYTWALLELAGTAGTNCVLTSNGKSIKITLDANGKASVSLLPFIRDAVMAQHGIDNPFAFDDTDNVAANLMRGSLYVNIQEGNNDGENIPVRYIFGALDPNRAEVTDVYFDYDRNSGKQNWGSIERTSLWTGSTPTNFENNYVNLHTIVGGTAVDFTTPLDVVNYYGKTIVFSTVTYHFLMDTRTQNVMRLRWMDEAGNINERKFTLAGKSYGAAIGESWRRPHATHEIDNYKYYPGRDEWRTIEAAESYTVGDDNLPMCYYDWLKTIASAPFVVAQINGYWQRCNVDCSLEVDPRKSTFSITITLAVPTPDIQQF